MTSFFSHPFWETCVFMVCFSSFYATTGMACMAPAFSTSFVSIADLLYKGTVVKYFIPATTFLYWSCCLNVSRQLF